MVYRKKGQFELSESSLMEVLESILKQPQNQDVEVRIDRSPNIYSKSLYVRFFIGDYTTTLRVSDHECKGEVRQMIITDSTGIANVYYKIDKTIKDLRLKRLHGLMEREA